MKIEFLVIIMMIILLLGFAVMAFALEYFGAIEVKAFNSIPLLVAEVAKRCVSGVGKQV